MMEKPDKYDLAITYLTEHPEEILRVWNSPEGYVDEGGCLFQYAGDTTREALNLSGKSIWVGCLTQIRDSDTWCAQTDELTEEIRADERIPKDPKEITVESLPVFAEWQRKLDQYDFRKEVR